MVDEELGLNSVRHGVHIASCRQGALATTNLLRATPSRALVNGYLAVLDDAPQPFNCIPHPEISISQNTPRPCAYQTIKSYDSRKMLLAPDPAAQQVNWAIQEADQLLRFWKNWRFSITDPLPWWWHNHVFLPLKAAVSILQAARNALTSQK